MEDTATTCSTGTLMATALRRRLLFTGMTSPAARLAHTNGVMAGQSLKTAIWRKPEGNTNYLPSRVWMRWRLGEKGFYDRHRTADEGEGPSHRQGNRGSIRWKRAQSARRSPLPYGHRRQALAAAARNIDLRVARRQRR